MATEASRQAISLRYWFRRKYNLAPTDPRYLEMTDEEILLERETELAFDGKPLKACACGYQTHMDACPQCVSDDGEAKELFGDHDVDDMFAKMEAGEDVDIESILRGEQFEPVVPTAGTE